MAIFKQFVSADIKTARSFLNQLIDVLEESVSGSASRRAYQHFVTGGIGLGVTSSLYQTVYDQDFTLQVANPIFDIAVGLNPAGDIVASSTLGTDAAGKELFPSQSLMMREKMDIYRQFSKTLLGSSSEPFNFGGSDVDAAMFMSFRRLFSRDGIKNQTFAMRMYMSASSGSKDAPNINFTSVSGSTYYTDFGSTISKQSGPGGMFSDVVDASNKSVKVGQIFYDRGIVVYDLAKVIDGDEHVTGTIKAMSPTGLGQIGDTSGNPNATFIPDFMVSGSVDDIVDCLCSTRFSSGSLSTVTFQNVTNINSTLVFCKAAADEFNYSQNPTYVDSNNRIVVIDPGQEDVQQSFTFVTTIGLYDPVGNLLAVAKLSRPVEKSSERDLTFRVRLDF